jgi:hypothetical protein
MPVSSKSIKIPKLETDSSIALCSRAAGNSACCLRPNNSEHGRPQQDAREQLSHYRGLADPLHSFAKEAANQEQNHNLRDE